MPLPAANRYDIVVVGGGIVGLATARELTRRFPRLRLIVIEKEKELASHQSSHNSGVLHSGIYYAPGSRKASACVEGHRLLMAYAAERGIPFSKCGKVIVALNERELPRLDELMRRGTANGVTGLELIGRERLKEIEPHAAGIKAIYSPNTGVIDFRQVALAYADDIRAAGGEVVTTCKVLNIRAGDPVVLDIHEWAEKRQTTVDARYVITCGGLHSDLLTATTIPDNDVMIIPFRGDYYALKPEKRSLVNALIYPVPDPGLPFLGVHLTRMVDGEVTAGPNAVLAFAREGYGRKDVALHEIREMMRFPGMWKLALSYWQQGLKEFSMDYVKSRYVREVQRYLPELTADDLLPGPSGVRAQALRRDGTLVDDFLLRHSGSVIHVQNAPSPAATSSLVIGRMIVDEAKQRFSLTQPSVFAQS
jgi:L-2-hydroxyglutarate oxidase LhgO